MIKCDKCQSANSDFMKRCISCNASLIGATKVQGSETAIPSTDEILKQSKYKNRDNSIPILWGIIWSLPGLAFMTTLFYKHGLTEGIYTGVPTVIVLFLVGYKRSKNRD
jgi:hypothetical protein